MDKQTLATEYVTKITAVMSDFMSDSKGTKGDVYEALATKAIRRIDTLIRNYDVKFGVITE